MIIIVDLMPVMPYASVAGVKTVLQFLAPGQPKAATANPEEFYDHSYSKENRGQRFHQTVCDSAVKTARGNRDKACGTGEVKS